MISILPTVDTRLLAQLNEPVQNWHHQNFPTFFKPFDEMSIRQFYIALFQQEKVKAFIAWKDNEALGYLILIYKSQDESAFQHAFESIYIDQIGVLPKFRNQGIGKQLLQQAFDIARKENIQQLRLDHWASNEKARYLFKNAGFKKHREQMYCDI